VSAILVVGKDSRARRMTIAALRHGGFEIRVVANAAHVGGVIRRNRLDGVVLVHDDPPAAEIVADLGERTDLPIIIIVERAEAADRVTLLDAGADDCVSHPVDIDEFLARMRARMRRFEQSDEFEEPIVTDDFTIYVADRRLVRIDGTEGALSPTEWKVVEVLLRRPGHLVSQEELLRSVWGPDATSKFGLLRVHIASIRRKVEPDPGHPCYFVTVPGLGITFAPVPLEARGSAS
jgi:two-component system KDP operon response regulator KdpE